MIHFKELYYQNFLSVGATPIIINLNEFSKTLIIGENGHGKSTLLDVLCFVLFGKAYRKINKNQLINSVNGKKCLTKVTFSVGNTEYKIVRGMKPEIFEIWCDDVMMNKNSALKDYQKVLEQQILKFNYKTFTQVVIIGSSSFKPFMKLTSGERREVIDELLDIRVFTTMGVLLKARIQDTKDRITEIKSALDLAQIKVTNQQKSIKLITDNRKEHASAIQDKIDSQKEQLDNLVDTSLKLVDEIDQLLPKISSYDDLTTNIKKLNKILIKKDTKISYIDDNIKFFNNNEICPQCSQGIAHEHKEVIIKKLTGDKETQFNDLNLGREKEKEFKEKLEYLDNLKSEITSKQIELRSIKSGIDIHKKNIIELESELTTLNSDKTDIEAEKALLRKIAKEALVLVDQKKALEAGKKLQDVSNVLLKDSGIKTAIIREYLPIMNKLINKYLGIMDVYIKFELDENFNEALKSRFRDEFTYDSFSDGEKLRIDISMLFAWRNIAKLKNSINTNLLFLDEIDRSLSESGTELLLSLLSEAEEKTNIFCISHKKNISDSFDNVIMFEKVGDFSTIKIEE